MRKSECTASECERKCERERDEEAKNASASGTGPMGLRFELVLHPLPAFVHFRRIVLGPKFDLSEFSSATSETQRDLYFS